MAFDNSNPRYSKALTRYMLFYLVLLGGFLLVIVFGLSTQITSTTVSERNSSDYLNAVANNRSEIQGFTSAFSLVEFNTGFLTDYDGFQFQNYGSRFPEGNLNVAEVHDLFGDQVCAQVRDGECVASPTTQLWIDQMNQAMGAGHCVGFTVLSHRLATGQLTPASFETVGEITFDITQNPAVMQRIAREWVLQTTPEIIEATVSGSPRDVVARLSELSEPVDLGIFHREGGGHSMLAFGVEDLGSGMARIPVYDNNWPGQLLYVEVDLIENTWAYSLAAAHPDDDPQAWTGDDRTHSLMYVPLSAYDQDFTCPFCNEAAQTASTGGVLAQQGAPQAGANQALLHLSGESGNVVATNSSGQRLGFVPGEGYVNEIPGAVIVPLRSNMFSNVEPLLILPPNEQVDIQVTARTDGDLSDVDLRYIGPGMNIAVDQLSMQSDNGANVAVDPNSQSTDVTVAGQQSPIIKLGVTDGDQTQTFSIGGASMPAGSAMQLGVDPSNGAFNIGGDNVNTNNMFLVAASVSQTGSQVFATDQLQLNQGNTQALDFANWDGVSSVGGLSPQPLSSVIVSQDSAADVIAAFGQIDDFLADDQVFQLLDGVAGLSLDGSDVGEVLYGLDGLELTAQEMVGFVQQLNLPVAELAELIAEQNLDETQQADLVGAFDLSDADLSELEDELTQLKMVDELLIEMEFQAASVEDVEEILTESGFDMDLVVDALDELDVPTDTFVKTLSDLGFSAQDVSAAVEDLGSDLFETPAPIPVSGAVSQTVVEVVSTAVPLQIIQPTAALAVPTVSVPTAVPPTAIPQVVAQVAPVNTEVPTVAVPTATVAQPTAVPAATNTPVPEPTNTNVPEPTSTPVPAATNTPVPTDMPTATNTVAPTATNTNVPTATNTVAPTATHTEVPTATNTVAPTATNTEVPTATNTVAPTATNTAVPTPTSTANPLGCTRIVKLQNSPYTGPFDEEIASDNYTGTDESECIYGNNADNIIEGGNGNDVIYGYDGTDYLYGDFEALAGSGNDTLYGGDGTDHLFGDSHDAAGSGNDTLYGGAGEDRLFGDSRLGDGSGSDALYGGEGSDKLFGDTNWGHGSGSDILEGGSGNDLLWGDSRNSTGAATDTIDGGDDDDTNKGPGNTNDTVSNVETDESTADSN